MKLLGNFFISNNYFRFGFTVIVAAIIYALSLPQRKTPDSTKEQSNCFYPYIWQILMVGGNLVGWTGDRKKQRRKRPVINKPPRKLLLIVKWLETCYG